MAGAYPSFRSMKQLRALLLPHGWDASPSQDYPPPPSVCRRNLFIHLGGERQRGVKYLVRGNNTMAGTGHQTTNLEVQCTNHYTNPPPPP